MVCRISKLSCSGLVAGGAVVVVADVIVGRIIVGRIIVVGIIVVGVVGTVAVVAAVVPSFPWLQEMPKNKNPITRTQLRLNARFIFRQTKRLETISSLLKIVYIFILGKYLKVRVFCSVLHFCIHYAPCIVRGYIYKKILNVLRISSLYHYIEESYGYAN